MEIKNKSDYLFEVSWEVCNKVGGIYTVVATKALSIEKILKDNYIVVGPNLDREGKGNPEFIEDQDLYKSWTAHIKSQGLSVKIGRWNIIGKPIAILIDFSPLFAKKNEIFAELWDEYKLDSLSGNWDYIEPALFGYAAGIIIKSFYSYHLSAGKKVVAQFHEWMTGSGLLYLAKYAPQIATVFTTHATVFGRSLAGNNLPLYNMIENIDVDSKVKEFNITSKHSLEKLSAVHSDIFTTVSDITANEATHFLNRKPEVITPNGFETNIVPEDGEYDQIKNKAHQTLKNVASSLLGYELSEDTKFIATSGRYEFQNKGIDVFIDAVAELNKKEKLNKHIVAFILVPANNYGARKDLLSNIKGETQNDLKNKFLTHYLHDADFDPILNKIKQLGFTNSKEQNAKIIFVPAYLNGNDGIFNMKYYDLIPAFRITAFPSYYEPWGYTPLESLAFHVPTITTTLTGFGLWIKNQNIDTGECMTVLHRDDKNYSEVVNEITSIFITCIYKNKEEENFERNNAYFISKNVQWKKLILNYFKAYDQAIEKAVERSRGLVIKEEKEEEITLHKIEINEPVWRSISIKPNLPEKLKGLEEISKNIWWEWNEQTIELFKEIDEKLWIKSKRNPVIFLKDVDYQRLLEIQASTDFMNKYHKVYNELKKYTNTPKRKDTPSIGYFSMEYGLTNVIKIFSGGLGILAGDYLKQASDNNINLVGVGLLYRNGYFHQKLSIKGEQIGQKDTQNFSDLPMELIYDENGKPLTVQLGLPGRILNIQIWKINVGRISLFLLDSDIESNSHEDRQITSQLYGGDNEHRLKQEIVLGIGGIRALRKMKVRMDIYHSNEGHSAFIGLERIAQYMVERRLTFAEAVEIIRASTLFTTHTPVPAGHDVFPEDLLMLYFGHYIDKLNISWADFIKLGKININDKKEKFSMSHLAANLSQEINGVSFLHGEVTKEMFAKLWPGYFPEESHIGYVTNGVHFQTWASDSMKKLVDKYFDKDSKTINQDKQTWNKIYEVPDEILWSMKNKSRQDLVNFIKERINSHFIRQRKSPQQIVAIQNKIKDNILTLGFARRFATYKRAHLLFYDTERLAEILNNPEHPVQLIFAGKAHPADVQGQELIQRIVEISKLPQFLGKIVFLENYDIEIAKKLVQGVDVWLNTPTRPLEASGTSGMKATMNGVLNLSVLDGWWVEGYKPQAGWALPQEKTYENTEFQNQLDAEMIYEILENEIIPLFYKRDNSNIPREWIRYMKKAISQIAPEFTTARMLDDYINKFYKKLAQRKISLKKNDYALVKEISSWKKRMIYYWDKIEIIDIITPKLDNQEFIVGDEYKTIIKLNTGEINPDYIAVELLIYDISTQEEKILEKINMKVKEIQDTIVTFSQKITPKKSGMFKYSFRIYPIHPTLPHRQDFPLMMWA